MSVRLKPGQVLGVRKWKDVFEYSSDLKECKTLRWISMPVGFGSNGLQMLFDDFGDRAAEMYGIWCLMLKVAATSSQRGKLGGSQGRAYSTGALSRMMMGISVDTLDELITWCVYRSGWLEIVEVEGYEHLRPEIAEREVSSEVDYEHSPPLIQSIESDYEHPADGMATVKGYEHRRPERLQRASNEPEVLTEADYEHPSSKKSAGDDYEHRPPESSGKSVKDSPPEISRGSPENPAYRTGQDKTRHSRPAGSARAREAPAGRPPGRDFGFGFQAVETSWASKVSERLRKSLEIKARWTEKNKLAVWRTSCWLQSLGRRSEAILDEICSVIQIENRRSRIGKPDRFLYRICLERSGDQDEFRKAWDATFLEGDP